MNSKVTRILLIFVLVLLAVDIVVRLDPFSVIQRQHPKITEMELSELITGRETGENTWGKFHEDSTRKIEILEEKYNGDTCSLVASVRTTFPDRIGLHRFYSGRLRFGCEWIVDRWEVADVNNLSFNKVEPESR